MNITEERAMVQKMYDDLFPNAQSIVASGNQHIEMIVVLDKEDNRGIIPLVGMDKDDIARGFAEIAKHRMMVCAALIMEGWMHKAERNGDTDKIIDAIQRGDINVSDLPNKGEAIIFHFRTPAGGVWLAICEINRSDNSLEKGELIDSSGREDPSKTASGRFIDVDKPNSTLH